GYLLVRLPVARQRADTEADEGARRLLFLLFHLREQLADRAGPVEISQRFVRADELHAVQDRAVDQAMERSVLFDLGDAVEVALAIEERIRVPGHIAGHIAGEQHGAQRKPEANRPIDAHQRQQEGNADEEEAVDAAHGYEAKPFGVLR